MTTSNAAATVCLSSNADANANTIQKLNADKPLHSLFSSTSESLTANWPFVHCAPNTKETTHMHTHDPHHNEYLAAIAAMPEHTISPRRCLDGHGIGDHVTFRLQGWGPSSYDDGRIVDVNERLNVLLVETAGDLVEVDPRPWPVGHVLPY